MADDGTPTKQRKGLNWTLIEVETLIHSMEEHQDALYGSFNSSAGLQNKRCVPSGKIKKRAWGEISLAVNKVSACGRTAADCKRKKECFASTVKKSSDDSQR